MIVVMTRRRVREALPLQVYLAAAAPERLDRLADQLAASKSDVVRRGLLALERELLDPDVHPALRLIGIATERPGVEAADAGREHDRLLADGEESRWNPPTRSSSRKATKTAAKRRAR